MVQAALNSILDDLEDDSRLDDPLAVFEAFQNWAKDAGTPLYPHQEQAALEIFSENHVIVSTPTGSGKTLIALAAHLHALAKDQRSYYTAPLKALVNEKFFALVNLFGAENVGLLTGDGSVNPEAPILCCTAEILANHALHSGSDLDAGVVIMDEFHFYADPERGWAWQVPLLELPHTQFVLLSATLGDTSFFENDLYERTQRKCVLVDQAQRPVPLQMHYTEMGMSHLIEKLVKEDRAPVYLVSFSQAEATKNAQALANANLASKTQRAAIAKELESFRFAKGFGKTMSRLLRLGIGLHHGGLLPKYRLLVERLATKGLLSVICGTDTLGVGINVPIRTVVLSGLAKYDGHSTRLLQAREFHQIAGRAGRAGFDEVGYVEVMSPNACAESDTDSSSSGNNSGLFLGAGASSRKDSSGKNSPKSKNKSASNTASRKDKGKITWDKGTFEKLQASKPERLKSQFRFTHSLVIRVLGRNKDSNEHLLWLADNNHNQTQEINPQLRVLGQIVRSLRKAEVIDLIDQYSDKPTLALKRALPEEFALNEPLAPFALAVAGTLDPQDAEYPWDLISVIEAILEDPKQILIRQERAEKDRLMNQARALGLDYNQRQEMLQEASWPRPLAEYLQQMFEVYRRDNPWVTFAEPAPKSILREMLSDNMTFSDYINRYDLQASEGTLLRYLSNAYKSLDQVIPPEYLDETLLQVKQWLQTQIASVDDSLLLEWERLRQIEQRKNPLSTTTNAVGENLYIGTGGSFESGDPEGEELGFESQFASTSPLYRYLGMSTHAARKLIRKEMWKIVELFSFNQIPTQDYLDTYDTAWSQTDWENELDDYWDEYDAVAITADAQANHHCKIYDRLSRQDLEGLLGVKHPWLTQVDDPHLIWVIDQEIDDGENNWEWSIRALLRIDLQKPQEKIDLRLHQIGPKEEFTILSGKTEEKHT